MSEIKLIFPAQFGEQILKLFLEQGWQSLSKRDLELLIFLSLEMDGAIDRFSSNHAVARSLRITPAKVAALRRDAYARWRTLSSESTEDVIKRVLSNTLTEGSLNNAARYASERRKEDGFLALLIEHPDYRTEFEEAIKDTGAIPIYERNREVLIIHYETLIKLAENMDLLEKDPAKLQAKLKKLCGSKTDLEGFLKKDIKELSWDNARDALNSVGAKVISGALTFGMSTLFQAIFPFLTK
jgi:sulfur transfer complex TusBCD TusB component (DsrH family)